MYNCGDYSPSYLSYDFIKPAIDEIMMILSIHIIALTHGRFTYHKEIILSSIKTMLHFSDSQSGVFLFAYPFLLSPPFCRKYASVQPVLKKSNCAGTFKNRSTTFILIDCQRIYKIFLKRKTFTCLKFQPLI